MTNEAIIDNPKSRRKHLFPDDLHDSSAVVMKRKVSELSRRRPTQDAGTLFRMLFKPSHLGSPPLSPLQYQ